LTESFEPKIVGFLCRWCSYAGADLAGTNRMMYPSNISSIRVNCSGRIDPNLVMKALALGADGVLIAGCHPGDCHYTNGNIKTLRRFKLLQKMLDQFGIERERVRLEWISAAEGEKYAQVARSMTEQVRSLGPLNWQRKVELTA